MFPPAGCGFVAVRGGHGHEHTDGTAVKEVAINMLTHIPHVLTNTNNTAELLGFTRALQWAATSPHTSDPLVPIVMRYDSCYAAMIASGTWRPHWHRALAAEAQAAWAALRKLKGERLWLRHVRGHRGHRWNNRADSLATQGQGGEDKDFELPCASAFSAFCQLGRSTRRGGCRCPFPA